MRRLGLLAAALVVPVLPAALAASPAYAADNVICVANPVGATCSDNAVDDTIRVGAGAYELRDTVGPDTVLTKKPKKRSYAAKVTFEFKASEPGTLFQCRLDGKAWKQCTSPTELRVKVGKHKFQVRAVDIAGNPDPKPARYSFWRLFRSNCTGEC